MRVTGPNGAALASTPVAPKRSGGGTFSLAETATPQAQNPVVALRTLGGALSWETPKRLAPFDRDSPFFGLSVPDEVTVSRQVLAEPEPGLAAKTWGRPADGTPPTIGPLVCDLK